PRAAPPSGPRPPSPRTPRPGRPTRSLAPFALAALSRRGRLRALRRRAGAAPAGARLGLLLLLLLDHGKVVSHRSLHDSLLGDRPQVGGDPVQADACRHIDDERDEDDRHAGEQELLLAIL